MHLWGFFVLFVCLISLYVQTWENLFFSLGLHFLNEVLGLLVCSFPSSSDSMNLASPVSLS